MIIPADFNKTVQIGVPGLGNCIQGIHTLHALSDFRISYDQVNRQFFKFIFIWFVHAALVAPSSDDGA